MLLVFSAILIQLLCRYYDFALQDWMIELLRSQVWAEAWHLRVAEGFRPLIFVSRFGIPILLIIFIFKWSWRDLGLGWPQMRKSVWALSAVAFVSIPLIVSLTQHNASYVDYYGASFANPDFSSSERFLRFFVFTLSTFFGWSFLHRSYLLFGGFRLLTERWGLKELQAQSIMIATVASFEVIYHFLKPDIESWALVLGSPLMCWVALRTKSIWVPVFFHFLVEASFIVTMILANP